MRSLTYLSSILSSWLFYTHSFALFIYQSISMFEDRANGPLTEPFPRWRNRPAKSKSRTGSPLGWGFEDVALWLERIRLSQYIPYFRRHRVTGPALLTLRRNQLASLGMTDRNDQDILLEGSKFLSRKVEDASFSKSAPLPPHLRFGRRFDALRSPIVHNLESKLRRFDRPKRSVVWRKKKPVIVATTERRKEHIETGCKKKGKKAVQFSSPSSTLEMTKRRVNVREGRSESGNTNLTARPARSQALSPNRKKRTEMRMKRLFQLFTNSRPQLSKDARSKGAFFRKRGGMRSGGACLG